MLCSSRYIQFQKKLIAIYVRSSDIGVDEAIVQIEELLRVVDNLDDRTEVNRIYEESDRVILLITIDTFQSFSVVSERYRQCVNRGFSSAWADCFCAVEYAEYCLLNGQSEVGLVVLKSSSERISSYQDSLSEDSKRDLLRKIDESSRRLLGQVAY